MGGSQMNLNRFLQDQGSDATRTIYGRYIRQFVEYHKTTHTKTTKMSTDEAEDALKSFVNHLKREQKSGQTIKVARNAVKQWFLANKIQIISKLKNVDDSKTYFDYIPTKDDVRKVLDECRIDYKVVVCLIAFSGMRPGDALKLKYESLKASYEREDEVLTISLQEEKKKNRYFTFLGPQGTRYMRELIERRKELG